MVYSDVVRQGLILPRKDKYTVADVKRLMVDSLFNPPRTLTYNEAVFIVKCNAVYHGTDYSKSVKTASAVQSMIH